MRVFPYPPTNSHSSILLCQGMKPLQDQGPTLSLMQGKASFSYIAILVPGSTWWSGQLALFFLWGGNLSQFLLPAPPPGTLSSVWWLAGSLLIGQMLAEPSMEQLPQLPVRKCFMERATLSGFCVYKQDESTGRAVPGWPFLQAPFSFCLSFGQEHFYAKNLRWVGGAMPQIGVVPMYCRYHYLQMMW